MGIFGFLGSIAFGIFMLLVLIVLGVIFFFMSGYQKIKRTIKGDSASNTSYSTGSSYQRYNSSNASSKRGWGGSKASSPRPSQTWSGPSSTNDVVEVPILEVTDVPESERK